MNDKGVIAIFVALGFGIPTVILALQIFAGYNESSLLFNGIIAFCFVPLIAFGMYMWTTGRGQMWINGVNWNALDEGQSQRTVRLMGLLIAALCIALFVSMALIFYDLTLFIIVMAAIIAAFMYPIYYVNSKKYRAKPAKEPRFSANAMLAISVAVIIASAAPALVLSDMVGDGTIKVNVTDDYVSVEGPMFPLKEFDYDKIEELKYDSNFDKGRRTNGFGTPTIQSGHFWNETFLDYMLASYAKVKPCIAIKYEGRWYAFNQSSVELTQQLYDDINDKMSGP